MSSVAYLFWDAVQLIQISISCWVVLLKQPNNVFPKERHVFAHSKGAMTALDTLEVYYTTTDLVFGPLDVLHSGQGIVISHEKRRRHWNAWQVDFFSDWFDLFLQKHLEVVSPLLEAASSITLSEVQ